MNKGFIDVITEYLDKDDMIESAVVGEGGAGSGNWGHRGRKGKRGGSLPKGASDGGGSFTGKELTYEVKDGKPRMRLENDEDFNTDWNYNDYKDSDDTLPTKRFNANERIIAKTEDIEWYYNEDGWKPGTAEAEFRKNYKKEFKAVRKMADEDAILDSIDEKQFYKRLKKIDNLMPDEIVINEKELGKHYLVKEYVDRVLTSRYHEDYPDYNYFNSEYTPWNSKAVQNRFRVDKEIYDVDVSDIMVRNYVQTLTGITKGYDVLYSTGAMDEYNFLGNAKTVSIKEVYIRNNGAIAPTVAGSCAPVSGNINFYSSSTTNSIEFFADTVFHENAHQLHGMKNPYTGNIMGKDSYDTFVKGMEKNHSKVKNLSSYTGYKDTSNFDDYLEYQFMNQTTRAKTNKIKGVNYYFPTDYSSSDHQEFFAECFKTYLSPSGILNPKNVKNVGGKEQQEEMERLSDWIGSVISATSNNKVKPAKVWEIE